MDHQFIDIPGFDFPTEFERASIVPFTELELPLVWASGAIIGSSEESSGGRPTVWQVAGDQFVFGYQTTENDCVIFVDWPLPDYRAALRAARQVTLKACT
jgi:hypothetical protein